MQIPSYRPYLTEVRESRLRSNGSTQSNAPTNTFYIQTNHIKSEYSKDDD